MADLKLGLLPKQRTVRITVVLCEPLKDERDAHAAEHRRLCEHESVETAALMPHVREVFIGADCAWCGRQKPTKRALNGRRSIHYRPPEDGVARDDGGR
jgi:hypothetical protein